jgi:hypothetical protein
MASDELDRPVTLREFNERFDQLIKRFDKLDEERAVEKQVREDEKKERDEEKKIRDEEKKVREDEKKELERVKAEYEEGRASVWKKLQECDFVEFAHLYFKYNRGYHLSPVVYRRLKEE